jgi:hypothetical protein
MQHQSTLLFAGLVGLATLLTPLPAHSLTFVGTDAGGTIPVTPSAATFNLTINNTSTQFISVTNVTLDVASLVAGADLSDIELYLSSPGGTIILTLKDSLSNFGLTTYTNVTFTDAGAATIDTAPMDPVTGSYQPEGTGGTYLTSTITNFAGFNGLGLSPGNNTWVVTAFNSDSINSATIGQLDLTVTGIEVPFEVNGALGLLVLGGCLTGHQWLKHHKFRLK